MLAPPLQLSCAPGWSIVDELEVLRLAKMKPALCLKGFDGKHEGDGKHANHLHLHLPVHSNLRHACTCCRYA